MHHMRQILLSFVLVLPLAGSAWGQVPTQPRDLPATPDTDPHPGQQDQVPDLQLLPPRGPGAEGRGPGSPPAQAAGPQRPVPKPPETEEQLLGRLAKAADQRGARAIERELKARWAHSGSPSADLLLKRTDQAMEAHDFDTARQIVGTIKADRVFHVPGEHDVFVDQGKRYLQTFGKGTQGSRIEPGVSALPVLPTANQNLAA